MTWFDIGYDLGICFEIIIRNFVRALHQYSIILNVPNETHWFKFTISFHDIIIFFNSTMYLINNIFKSSGFNWNRCRFHNWIVSWNLFHHLFARDRAASLFLFANFDRWNADQLSHRDTSMGCWRQTSPTKYFG